MCLSCTIAAGPRQRNLSQVQVPSESCRNHDHILLSQIQDSPNLEGQIPVFLTPSNRVAQLYPQALGYLSISSYDSQGYGGGIRPRLHTGLGLTADFPLTTYWVFDTSRTAYTRIRSQTVVLLFRMHSLPRNVSIELLPSNGRLFWLHYSGFYALVEATQTHRQQNDL
jgi:hypothetical protein